MLATAIYYIGVKYLSHQRRFKMEFFKQSLKNIFDAIISILLVVVIGFWFGVGMYLGVTYTMMLLS